MPNEQDQANIQAAIWENIRERMAREPLSQTLEPGDLLHALQLLKPGANPLASAVPTLASQPDEDTLHITVTTGIHFPTPSEEAETKKQGSIEVFRSVATLAVEEFATLQEKNLFFLLSPAQQEVIREATEQFITHIAHDPQPEQEAALTRPDTIHATITPDTATGEALIEQPAQKSDILDRFKPLAKLTQAALGELLGQEISILFPELTREQQETFGWGSLDIITAIVEAIGTQTNQPTDEGPLRRGTTETN
jgi:hypothetical protein